MGCGFALFKIEVPARPVLVIAFDSGNGVIVSYSLLLSRLLAKRKKIKRIAALRGCERRYEGDSLGGREQIGLQRPRRRRAEGPSISRRLRRRRRRCPVSSTSLWGHTLHMAAVQYRWTLSKSFFSVYGRRLTRCNAIWNTRPTELIFLRSNKYCLNCTFMDLIDFPPLFWFAAAAS